MTPMNWNDTLTINGHEITATPTAGMVVQYESGWYIIHGNEFLDRFTAWDNPGAFFDLELYLVDERGEFYNYTHAPSCTPVLLSPSDDYTAWDALGLLNTEADKSMSHLWGSFDLDAGYICAAPEGHPVYAPCDDCVEPGGYDATLRDMQKYGVLLAWLKQWEARNAA